MEKFLDVLDLVIFTVGVLVQTVLFIGGLKPKTAIRLSMITPFVFLGYMFIHLMRNDERYYSALWALLYSVVIHVIYRFFYTEMYEFRNRHRL